jgi:hypothetical protein
MEGNTLSSANNNKTSSGKKNNSSFNYQNNETDLIYPPCNSSKNDINIINNNSAKNTTKEDKKDINDINENISNQKKIINKNNRSYLSASNNNKQIILPSLINNKVVNFDKMLSRDYYRKIKERKGNIYSSLSPKYESIQPKCIMKVKYSQKSHYKRINNEFKTTFNDYIDINKFFNKYNNHMSPKEIHLDKMTGRQIRKNSPLPSYMINQCDRNAFNTFNDKSLEMNNYANGSLKELRSSFNDRKSFNYKLNEQINDNGKDKYAVEEINAIMKKIKYSRSIDYEIKECNSVVRNKRNISKISGNNTTFRKKIPQYYKINLDKLGKYPFFTSEKIDGFTLKTIKNNKSSIDLMTEEERKIFCLK